ncbi:MAG: hypothetical protein DWQ40_01515 [Actinobacteria bacterium]|nr:MAG: hypothetical protein DWQ40_01515 [Actinomycetota bacterium]
MKRTFVVAATVATLLVGGVALAIVATPDSAGPVAGEEAHETTTTTVPSDDDGVDVTFAEEEGSVEKTEPTAAKDHLEEPEEEPEHDTSPPDLAILYPEDGAHFSESKVAFEGIAEPGSQVFAAGYQADIDEEGHWRIVLILSPGGNVAKFTAVDAAGNESHAEVQVFLDVEEEPEEEPKESDFVAYQTYGSCGEEPPYDVWHGSGTPGTEVWVVSDFGSGHTVVGEKGKWELKVFFEEAPCNDEFAVVVESSDGYRKVFEFIRLCEGEEGESH